MEGRKLSAREEARLKKARYADSLCWTGIEFFSESGLSTSYNIVGDGIAALQSLDDLGAKLNKECEEMHQRLQERFNQCKRIAKEKGFLLARKKHKDPLVDSQLPDVDTGEHVGGLAPVASRPMYLQVPDDIKPFEDEKEERPHRKGLDVFGEIEWTLQEPTELNDCTTVRAFVEYRELEWKNWCLLCEYELPMIVWEQLPIDREGHLPVNEMVKPQLGYSSRLDNIYQEEIEKQGLEVTPVYTLLGGEVDALFMAMIEAKMFSSSQEVDDLMEITGGCPEKAQLEQMRGLVHLIKYQSLSGEVRLSYFFVDVEEE